MQEPITSFAGLDVHKDSTAIGAAEAGREAPRFVGTVGPELSQLLNALKSVGKPERMLVVYEAGPCGYGLARQLRTRGYCCEVVAAGKIARRPGERIKTDRRDALTLARLARSGGCGASTAESAATTQGATAAARSSLRWEKFLDAGA